MFIFTFFLLNQIFTFIKSNHDSLSLYFTFVLLSFTSNFIILYVHFPRHLLYLIFLNNHFYFLFYFPTHSLSIPLSRLQSNLRFSLQEVQLTVAPISIVPIRTIIILAIIIIIIMAYQLITTSYILTRWEYVIRIKGGNMTQF